ncbi:ROK family protein [Christensenellaceae bacterium NSJ-44]|uniref:ROK family protein n=1 Tax=Luoshenia tenuis TaxID=2763654 RepID=A0A926D158_9FIRM|nr:ROK family protein [Luoshenia tenuis]MBC8529614.1 ROK family protein [Luoshenia tenuis]
MGRSSNNAQVRLRNLQLIRDTLKTMAWGTKNTLAEQTGLSVATCGNLLSVMLEKGEVIELSADRPSGGRPARRFQYNADYYHTLCLACEAGGAGEKARAGYTICDALGQTVKAGEAQLESPVRDGIEGLIAQALEAFPDIRAIGVGLPGVVAQGRVLSCDLVELQGLDLGGDWEKRFGAAVELCNDMNCCAYGYHQSAALPAGDTNAYLIFPQGGAGFGPGCGIVVEGKVISGSTHLAGEVGCLPYPGGLKKMLSDLEDAAGKIAAASFVIAAIVAVVNPAVVTVSGAGVAQADLEAVRAACEAYIPEGHMPALVYRADNRADYLRGLLALTQQRLRYPEGEGQPV